MSSILFQVIVLASGRRQNSSRAVQPLSRETDLLTPPRPTHNSMCYARQHSKRADSLYLCQGSPPSLTRSHEACPPRRHSSPNAPDVSSNSLGHCKMHVTSSSIHTFRRSSCGTHGTLARGMMSAGTGLIREQPGGKRFSPKRRFEVVANCRSSRCRLSRRAAASAGTGLCQERVSSRRDDAQGADKMRGSSRWPTLGPIST